MASEITKNGGIAICAPIAPYYESRKQNKDLISEYGNYVEVHVSTPLSTCERRDTKGLYAKARNGDIKDFTGISSPYEDPQSPELKIDTGNLEINQCVDMVTNFLMKKKIISKIS